MGASDVLRHFTAGIRYSTDAGDEEIGTVDGWVVWRIFDEDLYVAADAISADAEPLGAAAASIIDAHPEAFIDSAVLVDRMHLERRWRGRRLSGTILAELLALLRLDPGSTVVVLQPEPQKPTGGPYEDGPERVSALQRLTKAYEESGLEPWGGGPVWRLPL